MTSSVAEEIRLSDYQAPGYTTESVHLRFEIHDGETKVSSTLRVVRQNPESTELYLDGEDLGLVSVSVDGRTLSENEYQVDEQGMTIFALHEAHEISIQTLIHPEQNTALEGLYKSSSMYCTQCEAQGFRKITYYQDRPDVLAKFTTTVEADSAYPTLLSNGNKIAEEVTGDGRRSVTWEDPFPKPSYLFALVAGDLSVLEDSFTTQSGRQVKLQIFSEPHNIGQCDYAMDVLKRSMRWDEEVYGREYDLDIFMIVAVEDFNMGAMENKGLNIFNTSCVLASPDTATDAAYLRVEAVVAHEYFHNWSGNRVTCRDWFQLSLKEGFTVLRDADFSGDMNAKSVKRIEDVGFLRSVQFAEDSSPLAHSVRPESYIEISNFYTTTIYEKGAEVVRMYRTLLGEQKFRAGTDLYFDRFDGQAVTTDDFAAVMAEVGDIDLTQFKLWYQQAGTPVLDVSEEFADNTLRLKVKQSCPDTPGQSDKQPFHMPVELGLLDAEGEAISLYDLQVDCDQKSRVIAETGSLLIELRASETELTFSHLEEKPVVSFLRNFSAPVRVNFSRDEEELAFLAQHDADGFIRWDSLQALWLNYFASGTEIDLAGLITNIASQPLETVEEQQLVATMLTVPDANYLMESIPGFDLDELLRRRKALRASLAASPVWPELYERFALDEVYQPNGAGMAGRSILNIAFSYMAENMSGDELLNLTQNHYRAADNLTNRRAALAVAINHEQYDAQARQALLKEFYERWQEEALVIDLWFSLQAQSDQTAVERLRELKSHASFDDSNPNRARSLYAAFAMFNHERFHAHDGSGYDFLTEVVADLDGRNPQLASRLATPLTRWGRYDDARQSLMQASLRTLSAREGISKDLFEIVSKSLPDA